MPICDRGGVEWHLLGVGLELGRRGILEGNGQRCDLVVVGAALQRGEHREIDAVLEIVRRLRSLALHRALTLRALHRNPACLKYHTRSTSPNYCVSCDCPF